MGIREGRKGTKKFIPSLRNDYVVNWRMARAKPRKPDLDNHLKCEMKKVAIVFNVMPQLEQELPLR